MSQSSNTTSAASIINSLEGNLSSGMCRCPAHDDRKASLHVTQADGRVLFKCHAGCSQESVLAALRSRGLWNGTKQNEAGTAAKLRTAVNDNDDRVVRHARVLRGLSILRKAEQFSQDHSERHDLTLGRYFHGRGLEVPSAAALLPSSACERLIGVKCPALVLPVISTSAGLIGAHVTLLTKSGRSKLNIDNPRRMFGPIKGGFIQLSPIDPKEPLIIAEGVETALSVSKITGFPAVAAMSAVNMPAVSLPTCKEVIVAGDHDEVGRQAARKTARSLADSGHRVRVALPRVPEGRSKYDWNDALRACSDFAGLRREIVAAERFKPSRAVRALPVEDFLHLDFPERAPLMSPWLMRSSLAMIHAQRGGAKTWLALSVAYAVATGQPLMNWQAGKPTRVLYVDGELPGKLLQKRLRLLGPNTDNLLILSRDLFHIHKALMPDLGEPAGREFLDEIIERHEIDLVVLDSLSTLVRSGVENDAESWAPIQDWALQHRWRDRTILFVHHEGRAGKPRGSSKREDVLDTMIGLKPRPDLGTPNASTYDLVFTKTREFFGVETAPLVVKLSVEDGTIGWSSEAVTDNNRERVAELLEQGFKQADIAKELGLTAGRVSQIVKDLKGRRAA